jgi:segregation and condensation protein B
MNEQYTRNVIEAGLLAAGRSLTLDELAQLFAEGEKPTASGVRAALDALEQDYAGRAVELRETASGIRIQVRRDFATEVARLWPERPQKYSRALLETLALVAYRQPITRAEIEAVRGVAVNPNIIRTLLERNWVRVVGHRELPGHPELLGTTREFLDYFGLKGLDDLPPLAELRSLEEIEPQMALPVSLAGELPEGDTAAGGSPGDLPEPAADQAHAPD